MDAKQVLYMILGIIAVVIMVAILYSVLNMGGGTGAIR